MAAGPNPDGEAQPEPHAIEPGLAESPHGQVRQRGPAGQVIAGHQLEGLAPEDAPAVELTPVGQHLAEGDVVAGGRHQPSCSREIGARPKVTARLGVIEEERGVGRPVLVERAQSLGRPFGDEEPGVGHAQRLEDLPAQVLVEALAREDLDQTTHDVGREAVVPLGPGLELQRVLGQERRDALRASTPGAAAARASAKRSSIGLPREERAGQTGGVHEQVADVHRAVGLDQVDRSVILHEPDLEGAPFGNVSVHGVGELEHAPVRRAA